MDKSERLLEELAVTVHTTLAVTHTLAAIHHLRRAERSWVHLTVHSIGAVYSALSVRHHLKEIRDAK